MKSSSTQTGRPERVGPPAFENYPSGRTSPESFHSAQVTIASVLPRASTQASADALVSTPSSAPSQTHLTSPSSAREPRVGPFVTEPSKIESRGAEPALTEATRPERVGPPHLEAAPALDSWQQLQERAEQVMRGAPSASVASIPQEVLPPSAQVWPQGRTTSATTPRPERVGPVFVESFARSSEDSVKDNLPTAERSETATPTRGRMPFIRQGSLSPISAREVRAFRSHTPLPQESRPARVGPSWETSASQSMLSPSTPSALTSSGVTRDQTERPFFPATLLSSESVERQSGTQLKNPSPRPPQLRPTQFFSSTAEPPVSAQEQSLAEPAVRSARPERVGPTPMEHPSKDLGQAGLTPNQAAPNLVVRQERVGPTLSEQTQSHRPEVDVAVPFQQQARPLGVDVKPDMGGTKLAPSKSEGDTSRPRVPRVGPSLWLEDLATQPQSSVAGEESETESVAGSTRRTPTPRNPSPKGLAYEVAPPLVRPARADERTGWPLKDMQPHERLGGQLRPERVGPTWMDLLPSHAPDVRNVSQSPVSPLPSQVRAQYDARERRAERVGPPGLSSTSLEVAPTLVPTAEQPSRPDSPTLARDSTPATSAPGRVVEKAQAAGPVHRHAPNPSQQSYRPEERLSQISSRQSHSDREGFSRSDDRQLALRDFGPRDTPSLFSEAEDANLRAMQRLPLRRPRGQALTQSSHPADRADDILRHPLTWFTDVTVRRPKKTARTPGLWHIGSACLPDSSKKIAVVARSYDQWGLRPVSRPGAPPLFGPKRYLEGAGYETAQEPAMRRFRQGNDRPQLMTGGNETVLLEQEGDRPIFGPISWSLVFDQAINPDKHRPFCPTRAFSGMNMSLVTPAQLKACSLDAQQEIVLFLAGVGPDFPNRRVNLRLSHESRIESEKFRRAVPVVPASFLAVRTLLAGDRRMFERMVMTAPVPLCHDLKTMAHPIIFQPETTFILFSSLAAKMFAVAPDAHLEQIYLAHATVDLLVGWFAADQRDIETQQRRFAAAQSASVARPSTRLSMHVTGDADFLPALNKRFSLMSQQTLGRYNKPADEVWCHLASNDYLVPLLGAAIRFAIHQAARDELGKATWDPSVASDKMDAFLDFRGAVQEDIANLATEGTAHERVPQAVHYWSLRALHSAIQLAQTQILNPTLKTTTREQFAVTESRAQPQRAMPAYGPQSPARLLHFEEATSDLQRTREDYEQYVRGPKVDAQNLFTLGDFRPQAIREMRKDAQR